MIVTDTMCQPLTDLLGGDTQARRTARALYHCGITDEAGLREAYDYEIPGLYPKGWHLWDVPGLGDKGLARIAETLSATGPGQG